MPLRIIGAGMPRTGTISLKVALEFLGFGPCYHMSELLQNMAHAPLWLDAYNSEGFDWERIFSRYGAAADMPACAFYRELAAHYPQAKVIMTIREPDSWYEFFTSTMGSAEFKGAVRGTSSVSDLQLLMAKMAERLPWGASRLGDREKITSAFEEHTRTVRESIPSERLLVYRVSEGWGPLCEFLECAVPKTPFPHLNTRTDFLAAVTAARKHGA